MREGVGARLLRASADAAAVLAVWAGMLFTELVVLGLGSADLFSGVWEISLARRLVVPIAIVALAPAAALVAAAWRVARAAAAGSRLARGALGGLGAAAAAALALGVAHGRHFAGWTTRGPFVAILAAAGALVGAWLVGRVAALGRRRPGALALLGVGLAVAGWSADAHVLPRLYPAFHLATMALSLLGGASIGLSAGAAAGAAPRRGAAVGAAALLVVLGCAAWAPHAARALDRYSNLRVVLVEHAPLLGPVVALEARLHPPPADDAQATAAAAGAAPGEVARSLDWSGHDILLISVDALRADHVSAYGYARPTTPNLDALAREGALFESAYCPTPHTSYSVTSMMTGKYMRPLFAMGLGEDSETWAEDLRRYGWRTAAFYPPAVFFIDEERFARFEEDRLGFEYAKVEFADPALRERQVAEYLAGAPAGTPLFLWVHFLEPHEPYVPHPDHVFTGGPSADVDLYDGEIAAADDGIGRIVRLVRARRPGAVVIVTADHGEELGEHGGRYHGTTVYEEQVRVPIVVVGPGVRAGARLPTVVQTIDLLPTALSALGIPRPARVRGRDLGPLLAGDPKAADAGFAFAEADDYALVAAGPDRLVCERRVAACALYRPAADPLERHDVSRADPARVEQLRARLRAVERDHGRYEASGGPSWPTPIRRGLEGDVEAATDVASLLDDADVVIRRKAAEVSYDLHAPPVAPALARALGRDEDDEVRRWSALALVRMGEPVPPLAQALLVDASRGWRRRAALALAERGDARACDEMAAWWRDVLPPAGQGSAQGEPPRLTIELGEARQLLAATATARCRSAVPELVQALVDVRARPYVADALGAIGDERARGPLRALFADEPYVTTQPHEARALLALGVHDWAATPPPTEVHASVAVPAGASRLLVLLSDPSATLDVASTGEGAVRAVPLPAAHGSRVHVDLRASTGGIVALWAVSGGRLD